MADAPIDPKDYIKPQVVQIEDLRVARGKTRRPRSACRHRQMVYDSDERCIWCQDCESEVKPFDAFIRICEVYGRAVEDLRRRNNELAEAEAHHLRSRAAKKLDEVWRSRNYAPVCPHCREAILPADVLNRGLAKASRELAERKRRKEKDNGL